MYQVKNKKGTVSLNKNIIGNIVIEAMSEYQDRVFLCNQKGKMLYQDPRNASMMDIAFDDKNFTVKFYILMRFGTSINTITNKIIDKIYEDTQSILGICPQKVTVVVSGIISKQIVKRNIEVSR
ncbi:MAG: Asp23/Gls24 family envelope stress response protein [Eubacteriales bacterium]|nr:Asp23/Gls24 family envelope stress response protein [Eubacteriales bacterium]MDD4390147.1 Asp23/Gls24 family envelope stress response protein [Eubacteriales bacterium]